MFHPWSVCVLFNSYVDSIKFQTDFQQRVQQLELIVIASSQGDDESESKLTTFTNANLSNHTLTSYPFLRWLQHCVKWLKNSLLLRFEEVHRIPVMVGVGVSTNCEGIFSLCTYCTLFDLMYVYICIYNVNNYLYR